MDKNVKLTLAYDGTRYLGWQKTPNGPTIEGTLQSVLEKILQHPIHLQAASRTDAGVHAQGQVVNFFTCKDTEKLQISLNGLLPKDIVVQKVEPTFPTFHPTLDCSSKEYLYQVCSGPYQLPAHRLYSWHIFAPLNLSNMQLACGYLIGTHDFASFTNVKKNEAYTTTIRTLDNFSIEELDNNRLYFLLRGKNFLYRMARNLVGTVISVGLGKLNPQSIPNILSGRDRTMAGVTAPAHGLTLRSIVY